MKANQSETITTIRNLLTVGWDSAEAGNLPAETYATVFELAVEKLDKLSEKETDPMSDVQVFKHAIFGQLRTITINGAVWVVGKDTAQALGYKDTVSALKYHVDEEDKRGWQITTPGGGQQAIIINESGLYSLILSSKLPNAKRFKRWVTSEVLPSIRATGSYRASATLPEAVADPSPVERRSLTVDDYLKAATVVASCRNERLPYVLGLLRKGGVDLPDVKPAEINDAYSRYQAVTESAQRAWAEIRERQQTLTMD